MEVWTAHAYRPVCELHTVMKPPRGYQTSRKCRSAWRRIWVSRFETALWLA